LILSELVDILSRKNSGKRSACWVMDNENRW